MAKKIIWCVVLVAFLVCSGLYIHFWCVERFLDFSLVDSYVVEDNAIDDDEFYWISLISEDYEPMWNVDYIDNKYNLGDQIEAYIDTDEFSYIVTFGYELQSISYKNSESRTKLGFFWPKQRTGKVVLSEEKKPVIYLYRIKKFNIVNDYYDNGEDMVLFRK